MRKKSLSFFVFSVTLLLLSGSVSADTEDVRVTVDLDKKTVELNEEINLSIKIQGAKTNLLRPRVPGVESFDAYYTGRSNQFVFVNGRSESTTTFNYVLVPKLAGKFDLPPIEVDVDGQIFRTEPIPLEVLGSQGMTSRAITAQPRAPSAQTPVSASSSVPVGGTIAQAPVQGPIPRTASVEQDRDIFLQLFADKFEAYVNEQILLTYAIMTRLSARPQQFEKEPSFSGFWVEEIPIPQNYEPERVQYKGEAYVRADIRRLAIFSTAPGKYEIEPMKFRSLVRKERRSSSLFDDFFDESFFGGTIFARNETRILTSPSLSLVVKPLPEEGKPKDFSGLVGSFTLTSSIDKRNVKQNEPINLKIVLEGQGNLETAERPKIPELPGFRIYDSDSSVQLFKGLAGVQGRKTFDVALIPTKAGTFDIPSLTMSYFDPRAQAYMQLKTSAYQVQVEPSAAEPPLLLPAEQARLLRKEIEIEARDIRFIKEKSDRLNGAQRERFVLGSLAAVNGLLTLAFSVLFIQRKREEIFEKDIALKRKRESPKLLKRNLKALQKLARIKEESEERRFFEEAYRYFTQFLSDQFNVSAQGLTLREIEERLESRKLDGQILGAVRHFYETCDLVRFTRTKVPVERCQEMIEIIRNVARALEKS